jgi:hypothetical protein
MKKSNAEERLRIVRHIEALRSGLITDLGPQEEDLTTAQLLLIDRLCCLLAICRAIEQHFEEDVMDGDSLKNALRSSYLAYNNTIRLTLQVLGIDKQASDRILSPLEYIKQLDQEKKSGQESTNSSGDSRD